MKKNVYLVIILFTILSCIVAQDNQNFLRRDHAPGHDNDGDLFAPNSETTYGSNWRGKDSNDNLSFVYPGKNTSDLNRDENCNGIYGKPDNDNRSYEDIYCKGSDAKGVIIFGDSAAAAFHIPWWRVQAAYQSRSYAQLFEPSRDGEFNWPQKSWATGKEEIDSIYLRMRNRNRANHRDYQNLAFNGAQMEDLSTQIGYLARKTDDKPILGFIAYIGNDICKSSLDQMTTVNQYRYHLMKGLEELDKRVAHGSKIVLVGFVDGRILWNTLHDKQHPLGMTYAEMYAFLTSMGKNPCQTWLTPNKEQRNAASQRAAELSHVAKEIAQTEKFLNFELTYIDFPLQEAITLWTSQGGDPRDLIEKVDGFHPSFVAHRLLAKIIWEKLEQRSPSFIGPVNSNNGKIIQLFGDQGGH